MLVDLLLILRGTYSVLSRIVTSLVYMLQIVLNWCSSVLVHLLLMLLVEACVLGASLILLLMLGRRLALGLLLLSNNRHLHSDFLCLVWELWPRELSREGMSCVTLEDPILKEGDVGLF